MDQVLYASVNSNSSAPHNSLSEGMKNTISCLSPQTDSVVNYPLDQYLVYSLLALMHRQTPQVHQSDNSVTNKQLCFRVIERLSSMKKQFHLLDLHEIDPTSRFTQRS